MLVFSLLWIFNSSFNDSSLLLPLLCAWTCGNSVRYQGALSCLHAASWEVEEAYSIFWWIVISKVGSMLISASWLAFARVCHFFPFLAICKSKSTVWELMFCLCCLSHWWCAGAWFLEELWKRAVFCSFAPLCSHYYTGDCFLQELRWLFCSGLWLSNQWSVAASNPQARQRPFDFLLSLSSNHWRKISSKRWSKQNFPTFPVYISFTWWEWSLVTS